MHTEERYSRTPDGPSPQKLEKLRGVAVGELWWSFATFSCLLLSVQLLRLDGRKELSGHIILYCQGTLEVVVRVVKNTPVILKINQ